MSEIDRSRMSTKPCRKKCKVCGERFIYYPYWHQWMAKVNGSHYEAVCRYNCMRKVEKEAKEKAERKEREREERRLKRVEDGYARGVIKRAETIKKSRPPEWYAEQIALCRNRRDEAAHKIKLLKNRGEWKTQTEQARRAMTRLVRYNEDRIAELHQTLEELRKEKRKDTQQ